MPQLSLYLDDEVMAMLREDAKREGVTLSKYAASAIVKAHENRGWPEGFWDLYGCMAGEDWFVAPDDPSPSPDDPREKMIEEWANGMWEVDCHVST